MYFLTSLFEKSTEQICNKIKKGYVPLFLLTRNFKENLSKVTNFYYYFYFYYYI